MAPAQQSECGRASTEPFKLIADGPIREFIEQACANIFAENCKTWCGQIALFRLIVPDAKL